MSLHLLPKKSWHVWNDDNLQRVARDESRAAAEAEAKAKKAIAIEAEAKVAQLRKKADDLSSTTGSAERTHLDLFEGRAKGIDGITFQPGAAELLKQVKTHPEYEAERKAAEERMKRAAGLAEWKFSDVTATKPWYLQSGSSDLTTKAGSRDGSRKDILDPLADMKRYVESTKLHHGIAPAEKVMNPPSKAVSSAPAPPSRNSRQADSHRQSRSSRSPSPSTARSRSRSRHSKRKQKDRRERSRSRHSRERKHSSHKKRHRERDGERTTTHRRRHSRSPSR